MSKKENLEEDLFHFFYSIIFISVFSLIYLPLSPCFWSVLINIFVYNLQVHMGLSENWAILIWCARLCTKLSFEIALCQGFQHGHCFTVLLLLHLDHMPSSVPLKLTLHVYFTVLFQTLRGPYNRNEPANQCLPIVEVQLGMACRALL